MKLTIIYCYCSGGPLNGGRGKALMMVYNKYPLPSFFFLYIKKRYTIIIKKEEKNNRKHYINPRRRKKKKNNDNTSLFFLSFLIIFSFLFYFPFLYFILLHIIIDIFDIWGKELFKLCEQDLFILLGFTITYFE